MLNTIEEAEMQFVPLSIIEGLRAEEVIKSLPPKDPPPTSGRLPEVIEGDQFLKTNYPVRRELIKGILHQGIKLILAGASKAGKTWLLLAMAIAVSTGRPWLGMPTRKGRVLYINMEILPDFFQERCRMVRDKMSIKSLGLLSIWNLRGYATDIEKLVNKILSKIAEGDGYVMVVLDPVYKCYGKRDENSASDMADFLGHLERIAATTGAAVVFATHYSKGNQANRNVLDRTSGSGVFARDSDTVITVTEHQRDDHFTVEAVIRNGPAISSFVLRKEFPLFVRDDTLDPRQLKRSNRPTKSTTQPAAPGPVGRKPKFPDEELVALLGTAGLTFADWKKSAKENLDCSETSFKEKRKALVDSGAVILKDGRYFPPANPDFANISLPQHEDTK
jgi:hypothetical protein